MKVAFFIHSLEVNSCRYRVLQFLPYLKEQGVDASIRFYPGGWKDRVSLYRGLGSYDILYVHRRLFHPAEFWALRRRARRIIYDFDDALMYRSSGSKNPHSFSRRVKFAFMMKRVDFIIAGNQFLKGEALRYNPNVEVIPTSIDLSRYKAKENLRPEGAVTVGWLGSGSTLKYLKTMMPALESLYEEHPHFRLKVVCDQFVESDRLPVIKKAWSSDEEQSDLRSFDIGIMPLVDDLWSRGKCGFKILQYYGVGVPAVCTPVGVNRDMVRHGVSGFWAENEAEWKQCLLELMGNETLRGEMGRKGRETVERDYSLQANAPRLLHVLRKVSG